MAGPVCETKKTANLFKSRVREIVIEKQYMSKYHTIEGLEISVTHEPEFSEHKCIREQLCSFLMNVIKLGVWLFKTMIMTTIVNEI